MRSQTITITILGPPKIGKSSLAKKLQYFLTMWTGRSISLVDKDHPQGISSRHRKAGLLQLEREDVNIVIRTGPPE